MSFNEKEEMVLLWKFCSRGTVQDIIYNSEVVLDSKFHGAFVRDITLAWIKQSQSRRQMADIYAFGMVMYEILFRSLPFPNATNIDELLDYIRDGQKTYRPTIQDKSEIHPDLTALLLDCWNENPEVRPSIRRVRLNTESYLKVKGSLVDQMMRMMEQYANNLEKLVQERTGMLEDANAKADKLLSQLLPKYVANELKLGRSVPPKTFQSATVMFSDIVGFTTICSSSTPLEVVNMLNAIYSKFDDVINKNQAYKVETIGDAYMVVSGIPEENGTKHIMHIADTSLDIMEVNMASRMESTGEPEKIQMSECANDLLNKYYPEYQTAQRGTVPVKGKGDCTTYWLLGRSTGS
ncbi:adenylate/guanylate cyclase catalytic domain protein [Ancylostoma duodenale]|uniref:guanylate cyclase n=1 Tax=Ancylostoma duodenale TaxID=51022 RepID=A0A0C2DE51_9BILA|nr:adenylate/guanylate cyclase catalytic domain protein [Ancylostoma duodenale]